MITGSLRTGFVLLAFGGGFLALGLIVIKVGLLGVITADLLFVGCLAGGMAATATFVAGFTGTFFVSTAATTEAFMAGFAGAVFEAAEATIVAGFIDSWDDNPEVVQPIGNAAIMSRSPRLPRVVEV